MVYETGVVSFFRTVLIIALAYYSIRFIVKLLTKKSPPNIPNPGNNKGKKKGNDDLGEYVDFEEVED